VSHHPVSAAELTRPARHIFLSPHYDDIALSAGGTARLLAAAGRAPEIALLFGNEPDLAQPLTPFAEQMHEGWGLSTAQVVQDRRAEEAAASAILGTTDAYLPFHDAIYRHDFYDSQEKLFDTPDPREAALPGEIVSALGLGDDAKKETRIYAPLAIGFHVDHQTTYLAAKQLSAAGWEVWLYEDIPYALLAGSRQRRLDAVAEEVIAGPSIDISYAWTAKLDAIMCFPSQLPTIFDYVNVAPTRDAIDTALHTYAKEGDSSVERFWVFV
jgi:LmbE family N-acetylglucosaminyl deacetylase